MARPSHRGGVPTFRGLRALLGDVGAVSAGFKLVLTASRIESRHAISAPARKWAIRDDGGVRVGSWVGDGERRSE